MALRVLYAPLVSGIRASLRETTALLHRRLRPPENAASFPLYRFLEIAPRLERHRRTNGRVGRIKAQPIFPLSRIEPGVKRAPDHFAAHTPALAQKNIPVTCVASVTLVVALMVSCAPVR